MGALALVESVYGYRIPRREHERPHWPRGFACDFGRIWRPREVLALLNHVVSGSTRFGTRHVFQRALSEPRNSPATPGRLPSSICRSSDDGRIVFNLIPLAGAVFVERTRIVEQTGVFAQSILFRDNDSFLRWCEADRLRFKYPLLFELLKRSAQALFVDAA